MIKKQIEYVLLADNHKIKEIVFSFKDHYYKSESLSDERLNNLSNKYKDFGKIMIATDYDEIFGYIAYYRNNFEKCIAYISTVVIKKEFRGFGIGKTLLEKVILDCKLHGFKEIKLEVDNNNNRAISLYSKMGFVRTQSASRDSSYYSLAFNNM